jgi:hypothetical protein
MQRFFLVLVTALTIGSFAHAESREQAAPPKRPILGLHLPGAEARMIRMAALPAAQGFALQRAHLYHVCVQLPSKCSSNSDCSCSRCCSSWNVCQPSC